MQVGALGRAGPGAGLQVLTDGKHRGFGISERVCVPGVQVCVHARTQVFTLCPLHKKNASSKQSESVMESLLSHTLHRVETPPEQESFLRKPMSGETVDDPLDAAFSRIANTGHHRHGSPGTRAQEFSVPFNGKTKCGGSRLQLRRHLCCHFYVPES